MELLEAEFGPQGVGLMAGVKQFLDPHMIMNPGKIFSEQVLANNLSKKRTSD